MGAGAECVPRAAEAVPAAAAPVKLVAFYLPQFHAIPDNDAWWGTGFTEWTNVSKALPQFEGHYQPHLPGDLGFYDLRVPETLRRQVELAQHYGIAGFSFYCYWFGGRKFLELPLERYLADPTLDLPFCLTWANESWSRRWDGKEDEVLLVQPHDPESDFRFIAYAEPYLRDPRYIRIDGRPLLIVYRAQLMARPSETTARWREYCVQAGLGEPYLVAAQVFGMEDPRPFGFDAAVQFPPNQMMHKRYEVTADIRPVNPEFAGRVFSYPGIVEERLSTWDRPPYPLFQTVFPSWDNQARRPGEGVAFVWSSPKEYGRWLRHAARWTIESKPPSERFVFINAWNEWAEGAHLEPDRRFGHGYLAATGEVLKTLRDL